MAWSKVISLAAEAREELAAGAARERAAREAREAALPEDEGVFRALYPPHLWRY